MKKDNPFPTACAYICEHPCKARCRRNMADDAINIRGLKRYAVDTAGEETRLSRNLSEKVSWGTGASFVAHRAQFGLIAGSSIQAKAGTTFQCEPLGPWLICICDLTSTI